MICISRRRRGEKINLHDLEPDNIPLNLTLQYFQRERGRERERGGVVKANIPLNILSPHK